MDRGNRRWRGSGSLGISGGDRKFRKSVIQVSSELQQTQGTVLYVSRRRKLRLSNQNACGASQDASRRILYLHAETNLEDIVAQVEALKPDYVVSTRFK